MKKIISLFLCVVLFCSNILTMDVHANDNFYTKQSENLLEYLQTGYPVLLQQNKKYRYVQFVNSFNSSWKCLYFLHIADFFAQTGVAPDEKKYKEVLLNIIQTYDFSESENITIQKKLDNLKTFEDYGKDTVKVGAQAVSVMSGMNSSTSQFEKDISLAVDGLSVLIDTTENWIDALSDLETIMQNYSHYSEFLELIENNSGGELKKAAISLKDALDSGIKIKLETYRDVTIENFEKWGEEFFTDIFFESCKLTKEYKTDETLKWFVDSGENLAGNINVLSDSWELGKLIGILVGNLTVGGENLANRLLETMAVKEISDILSKSLQEMIIEEFPVITGTEKEISFIQRYVAISGFLVDCRIRGEYCWYSVISNDAGLLSWFNKETGKKAEEIYNNTVEAMENVKIELEKIITAPETNEIETNIIYEYVNGQFLSNFYLEEINGTKTAYLSFWTNYGMSATVEDFDFLWNDSQSKYEMQGKRSGKVFDVDIESENEDIIKINVTCKEEYFNWITGEKDKLWSSAEYQRKKTETENESISKITEEKAIELAKQKMGDNFGYVYSQMMEYEGVNYFVILVKGQVDAPNAPVTTLTKLFISEDGTIIREGADYIRNGNVMIDFFE